MIKRENYAGRETFSQLELDTRQVEKSKPKRKRCPRGDCNGFLDLHVSNFVCPECGYVQKLLLEHSHERISAIHKQSIVKEQVLKRKNHYKTPQSRRMRGVKLSLKAQIKQLCSRICFEGSELMQNRCMMLYRRLKTRMENIPTWITIPLIYFACFTLKNPPLFLCDVVNLFRSGIVQYESPWVGYYNQFQKDMNENYQELEDIVNVACVTTPIPRSIVRVYAIGVYFFRRDLNVILGDEFKVERYLKELLDRLFISNSDMFIVHRHILYERCVILLKEVGGGNPFVNETGEEFNEFPIEAHLGVYVLSALCTLYKKDDPRFEELVSQMEEERTLRQRYVELGTKKGTVLPQMLMEVPEKVSKATFANPKIQSLGHSVSTISEFRHPIPDAQYPNFVKQSFNPPLYRRKNYTNYSYLFQDEFLKTITLPKTAKFVKHNLKDYDENEENEVSLIKSLCEKTNEKVFDVFLLNNERNPWRRFFDMLYGVLHIKIDIDKQAEIYSRVEILVELFASVEDSTMDLTS